MTPDETQWWQGVFDELYLVTDARSVCDKNLTTREVDFLTKEVIPTNSGPLLDLCGGQGRHSLELAKRGCADLVVLDYSGCLLDLGQKNARAEQLNVTFVRGDARHIPLAGDSFQVVMIMGSSFGYFVEKEENCRVLLEVSRVLAPGGKIVLDIPDREYVLANFSETSEHRANPDITVQRTRQLDGDLIRSKEEIHSDTRGCLRETEYHMQLYSPERISELLAETGFREINCRRNFVTRDGTGADYGFMTARMIVTAAKPG